MRHRVMRWPCQFLLWPGSALRASGADQPTHMLLQPMDPYRVVYATARLTCHKAAWNHTSWRFPRAPRRYWARYPTLPRSGRARLLYRRGHAVPCLLAAADQQETEEASGSPLQVKAPSASPAGLVRAVKREEPRVVRRSSRLSVRALAQPGPDRHNRRLQRRFPLTP